MYKHIIKIIFALSICCPINVIAQFYGHVKKNDSIIKHYKTYSITREYRNGFRIIQLKDSLDQLLTNQIPFTPEIEYLLNPFEVINIDSDDELIAKYNITTTLLNNKKAHSKISNITWYIKNLKWEIEFRLPLEGIHDFIIKSNVRIPAYEYLTEKCLKTSRTGNTQTAIFRIKIKNKRVFAINAFLIISAT